MKIRITRRLLVCATLMTAPMFAATCESLAALELPDTTVTMAANVAAGAFTLSTPGAAAVRDLPAFCRVALTLKPTGDSDIKVEVWLPTSVWNQKFEAVGNGAWAGSINYEAMTEALRRGYATR